MNIQKAHDVAPPEWLAQVREPALCPEQIIVDPHHHLWDRQGQLYLLPQFLEDQAGDHRIVSTVYVQGRAMYRAGAHALAPVGETEFARGVAAMCASGRYGETRVCDGIVAHADLTQGDGVERVLQAHVEAGGRHFKGIRHMATWDADPALMNPDVAPPPHLLGETRFRRGFAVLDRMGLVFDAWVFHPQLADVVALASAFPDTTIVLNHLGGILNTGSYAGRREAIRADWLASLRELATCPNVYLKLGGLGMRISGFDYPSRPRPPNSTELAADFAPYMLPAIDLFGPERCMFESNFPVDKRSYTYGVLWNAFKRLAADMSQAERDHLFYRTAAKAYRLNLDHIAAD
ncbi:amidohydrolase family protein [Bordetella bronchiseptica]|uniref:amidohydrolase family protein n=1 Tax=Bordetella bronchiseptica TaxID=518 RepID=UPI00049FFC3F|nr:amidohydrolase family protein [Bordetella bronchiseptica]KDB65074.1 amidohydrolase family protein [Bordetella bronchiseptica A1-7]KDB72470.1 amidohydrolase family protein [Bordetella bronchiseptica B20-10725633]